MMQETKDLVTEFGLEKWAKFQDGLSFPKKIPNS